jgi:hypothetical protein
MPVQVEYDPSRETIVDPKTGRNIRRYQKEPCEHPIRLTDKNHDLGWFTNIDS